MIDIFIHGKLARDADSQTIGKVKQNIDEQQDPFKKKPEEKK